MVLIVVSKAIRSSALFGFSFADSTQGPQMDLFSPGNLIWPEPLLPFSDGLTQILFKSG